MYYFFYVGPVEKSFDIVNMNLGTAMLNGRFRCKMGPYPGNELPIQ